MEAPCLPSTHHAEAPLLAAGPGLIRLGDVRPVAVDVEVDAVAVDARRRVRVRTLQVPRRVHRRAHLGALQCHTSFNPQLSTLKEERRNTLDKGRTSLEFKCMFEITATNLSV